MMKPMFSSLVVLPLAVLAGCILAGCELGGNPHTGGNNSTGNNFSDNTRFFGTYTGLLTTVVGSSPITSPKTMTIGADWDLRNNSDYFYVPLNDSQITFTDTNSVNPYTETLTVWNDSLTARIEDDKGSEDIRMTFATDYNSFTYENTEYVGTQILQHNGNFARPGTSTSSSTNATMRLKSID